MVMSVIKRRTGSPLAADNYWRRVRSARLKVLTRNDMIL
jgi:hypothetical protein